jgi:hypothetical protein
LSAGAAAGDAVVVVTTVVVVTLGLGATVVGVGARTCDAREDALDRSAAPRVPPSVEVVTGTVVVVGSPPTRGAGRVVEVVG